MLNNPFQNLTPQLVFMHVNNELLIALSVLTFTHAQSGIPVLNTLPKDTKSLMTRVGLKPATLGSQVECETTKPQRPT